MLTDRIADLRAFLCHRPALIVHFSGCPKGIGSAVNFPDDLVFALANPEEVLCCSTIEPKDFDYFPFAATGYVGVVLDPLEEASIIYVDHEDHGAPKTTEERRAMDRPETLESCQRSLLRDGDTPYNEWLVGPSRVVGLFIAPGAQIQNPDRTFRDTTIEEVFSKLGRQRLFGCHNGSFFEFGLESVWAPLDISTTYSERCAHDTASVKPSQ